MERLDEERTLNARPLVAALLVLAALAIWAATAIAGGGSSSPPKSAPTGDGAGPAYIQDQGRGASRHDSSSARSGKCRDRGGSDSRGTSQV